MRPLANRIITKVVKTNPNLKEKQNILKPLSGSDNFCGKTNRVNILD